MKSIKHFEEFLRLGVAKKQSPDKSRSAFLVKEAEKSYKSLLEMVQKLGVGDLHVDSYVKEGHDILMSFVRAKMLIDGYSASGWGGHEAEVSYLRNLGFSENEVQFADQLRFFRNGILYYGTELDEGYAMKVLDFLKEMIPKLKKILESKK